MQVAIGPQPDSDHSGLPSGAARCSTGPETCP